MLHASVSTDHPQVLITYMLFKTQNKVHICLIRYLINCTSVVPQQDEFYKKKKIYDIIIKFFMWYLKKYVVKQFVTLLFQNSYFVQLPPGNNPIAVNKYY